MNGRFIITSFILLTGITHIARVQDQATSALSGGNKATLQEAIDARTDVWGDAAMSQPDGANYEFFADLMPPVRWTDAEFRHYPIVLAAPRSAKRYGSSAMAAESIHGPTKCPCGTSKECPFRFTSVKRSSRSGKN